MIVKRSNLGRLIDKIFRRDPMPDERFEFDQDLIDRFNPDYDVVIKHSPKYDRQIGTLSPFDREKIKKFRKAIKGGAFYGQDGDEEDTHFLSDFSKKNEHVLSKKINNNDRLNYRVRKPELRKNEDGSYTYHSEVIFDSCKGHELNGTPDYVKDEDYKNLKRNKNSNKNDT